MDQNHTKLVVQHRDYLQKRSDTLQKMSANQSPGFVDAVIRTAIVEMSKNDKLAVCSQESIFFAVVRACQFGLVAGGGLARAYLIPRYNKEKGVSEAELQIGYEGIIDILKRSGEVTAVVTRVVFEKDQFVHRFTSKEGEMLDHTPCYDEDRGNAKGVYAVAFLANGQSQVEYVTAGEISKIKAKAMGGGARGPWAEFPHQMWRKSAVKRLAKYLRLDPATQSILEYDLSSELGRDLPPIDPSFANNVHSEEPEVQIIVPDSSAPLSLVQAINQEGQ